jgi:hypothetical protein
MDKWAKTALDNGIGYETYKSRVRKYGWERETAATIPVKKARKHNFNKDLLKLAESKGISYELFRDRVTKLRWTQEEAATRPAKEIKRRDDYHFIILAKKNGISRKTYLRRIKRGLIPEVAATKPLRVHAPRKDRDWIEIAKANGINYYTYFSRVHDNFWSPEEAANTPAMTKQEVANLAVNIKAEQAEIINERIFKDPNNLFKITPQHKKIAQENGISEHTLAHRVYSQGMSVSEAIVTPIKEPKISLSSFKDHLLIARDNGICKATFYGRIKNGWGSHEAATKSVLSRTRRTRKDKEWVNTAINNGVNYHTYLSRIKRGWTEEEAASIPALKAGQYLNEEKKKASLESFKRFRGVYKMGD